MPSSPRAATLAASLLASLLIALPAQAGLVTFGDTAATETDCTFTCGGRLQQDYSAAAFGAVPLTISRVSFFFSSLSPTSVPLFDLVLATNAKGSGLGTNLAANLGGDALTFATGPGTLGAPNRIDFYGSFAYDPSGGDLVLDIGTAAPLDGAFLVTHMVDRAYLWRGDGLVYADAGYGIVTQFQTLDRTPSGVPEPATPLLFGAALALIGVGSRRRGR